jgi:hypothetical protein
VVLKIMMAGTTSAALHHPRADIVWKSLLFYLVLSMSPPSDEDVIHIAHKLRCRTGAVHPHKETVCMVLQASLGTRPS